MPFDGSDAVTVSCLVCVYGAPVRASIRYRCISLARARPRGR